MNDPWWKKNPLRFLSEMESLEQLVRADACFRLDPPTSENEELRLTGTLRIGELDKKFVLIYPHLFPLVCPLVRPQEKERWSAHQYGEGGSICLEIGPDNWDPTKYTARDLLESLKRLIEGEQPDGETKREVPSRHEESEAQRLVDSFFRFVLPQGDLELPNVPSAGLCSLSSAVSSENGPIWISEFPKDKEISVPHGLNHASYMKRTVNFFVFENLDFDVSMAKIIVLPAVARLLIENQLGEEEAKIFDALNNDEFCLFIFRGLAPILVRISKGDDGKPKLKQVPSAQFDRHQRLDPGALAVFSKARVTLVGLGSVGSKVAVSLARMGIRDFILVDDEILEFGNIVRHEATMADVSAHKVDMVADLIEHISPSKPKIQRERIKIGGQINPSRYARIVRDIAGSDLIIDCTANAEAFQSLAALCATEEKPLVWGEVFAGGIGGIVGCCHPLKTPSPLIVKQALYEYLSVQPEAPYKTVEQQYGDGPLIADDNSVALIANLMVFRAKQFFLDKMTDDDSSCWIVGFTRTWIFNEDFEIKTVPCRAEDFPEGLGWGKQQSVTALTQEQQRRFSSYFPPRTDAPDHGN